MKKIILPLALIVIGLMFAGTGASAQKQDPYQSVFAVDKAKLSDTGGSSFFRLEPGTRFFYEEGKNTLIVTILLETKIVEGGKTRIIEERETENGRIAEISRNFFAVDPASGDVYYFGEEVDIYRNVKISSHEGAWQSGVGGDRFGLYVPGRPSVGLKYYQELAKNAKDRAEIASLAEEIKTPAGLFKNCLHIKDSSALESETGDKWFAPGVGMIKDDGFLLVKIEKPAAPGETAK